MYNLVSTACVLSVLIATSCAAPLQSGQISASANLQVGAGGAGASNSNGNGLNGITNLLSDIDLPGLLRGVNSFVKLVGVFCPPLSQVLDNVIQNVTSTAFRVFGRLILQNGGLGGGGGSNAASEGGSGQRVNVVLPTFPPDDYDDEDEDEEDNETKVVSSSSESTPASSVSDISDDDLRTSSGSSQNSTDANNLSRVPPESNDQTNNTTATLYTSPLNDENTISKRHVRVVREADDQVGAESAPQPAEDLSNVNVDDADRNKRFLPFGGGDAHGSTGGSGNFLFDIIRNTADSAARTVGTVYRMVAGTENLDLPPTAETVQEIAPLPTAALASSVATSVASSVATLAATVGAASANPVQLVAGSGATEETDAKAAAPGGIAELDLQKTGDGYTEGIPGPITRLFVIANRGFANLVQDLILRLAQTSERLVNFKARLVTSLI